MPRNSSGTMSAPAGQPAVSGTTISSTTFNTLVGDLTAELTDSLSRSGKGGMLAPVRTPDGSVAAPAHSFTSETGTGFYKSAAGEIAVALGGVLASKLTAFGMAVYGSARAFLQSTAANSVVQILGNRNAADTGADVELNGQVTRTAGLLVQVDNNSVPKLNVDFQGLLQLGSQAAAIQPASIWTAITPDTNVTASRGLAYTKDAVGKVHVRGVITNNTGGNIINVNATNPLPVGFRPASARDFATPQGNVSVASTGVIQFFLAFPAGASASLDVISFFAE